MTDTLNEALENATDGLTTEDDLEVSTEEESSEDEQTDEVESTEEESTEESTDESTEEEVDKPKEEDAEDEDKESFTKVNPNDLPDEVKPVYKSLLADYTRKRQQEAQVVKDLQTEVETLKGQIANGGGQGRPQNAGQVQIDLTPEQIGEMTLPEYTQYVINKALEVQNSGQEAREVQNFEQEAVTGFLSIDGRLNPELENSYDPRFASYVGNKVDQDYEAHIAKTGSPIGFDYKGAAEKHIKDWDDWVNGIKKESVKSTTQASKQQAQKLKKSAPPTTTAKSRKSSKMDLTGAIDAAFDEATE